MKLNVSKRIAQKKSEAKRLRRANNIPAILYLKGKHSDNVAIDGAEFQKHLNTMRKGHLATTVFTLVDADGKEVKAIVKEIQYHPTTYNILHLDLEILHEDVPVNVRVPIVPKGVADCVGIKLGGVLRQVIRHLKVRCLPKNLPENFELDIRDLKMKDSLRLRDIVIPEGLKPMVPDLNEVAMVIVKR